MATRKEKVLAFIHENGAITAEQAEQIGVSYLSQVVSQLRKAGQPIVAKKGQPNGLPGRPQSVYSLED